MAEAVRTKHKNKHDKKKRKNANKDVSLENENGILPATESTTSVIHIETDKKPSETALDNDVALRLTDKGETLTDKSTDECSGLKFAGCSGDSSKLLEAELQISEVEPEKAKTKIEPHPEEKGELVDTKCSEFTEKLKEGVSYQELQLCLDSFVKPQEAETEKGIIDQLLLLVVDSPESVPENIPRELVDSQTPRRSNLTSRSINNELEVSVSADNTQSTFTEGVVSKHSKSNDNNQGKDVEFAAKVKEGQCRGVTVAPGGLDISIGATEKLADGSEKVNTESHGGVHEDTSLPLLDKPFEVQTEAKIYAVGESRGERGIVTSPRRLRRVTVSLHEGVNIGDVESKASLPGEVSSIGDTTSQANTSSSVREDVDTSDSRVDIKSISFASLQHELQQLQANAPEVASAPEELTCITLPPVDAADSTPSAPVCELKNAQSTYKPAILNDIPDSMVATQRLMLEGHMTVTQDEGRGMVTHRTKVAHRKIGIVQALVREESLRPFTESQLKALYFNRELETNSSFINNFVEEHRSLVKHEFYELLTGYLRARNNLQISTKDIQMLQQEYSISKDHLWVTTEHVVQGKGHCDDGKLVTGTYQYHKAKFSEGAASKVARLLQQIRAQLYDHYSLHAYTAQMARLQVESYLHKLLLSSPDLKDIPHNAPVQGCLSSQLSPSVSAQVENVRQCISIIFHFQRKPIKDKLFIEETRAWLTRLVAVVLRVATFDDHLFLLNHVLRCPAGIEDWAVSYIQPPPPSTVLDEEGFGGPFLDHTVSILATLLLPVKGREEFLQHVKAAVMTASLYDEDESLWVLVDSDGEEDEDPSTYWLHWRENDLVSLLNQVPVEAMFRHILRIDCRDETDIYDVNLTTEQSMLRLLAFATQLIGILKEGLKTFNLVRYRQLAKRLSRLVRHTVQYISDHWLNFQSRHATFDKALAMRLQVEFDQFFLRATYCIFSSQRLGAWQFMAGLPYTCVSTSMLWQIIRLLHSTYQEDKDLDQLSSIDSQTELHDQGLKMQFEESLLTMPECEAYYLLTAFANMACSRPENSREFVETIAMEIYEIAFVSNHTRELCSKGGRELLAMVASKHPFIVSRLIHRVRETMTQVGMVSLYLFRELPLHLWMPNAEDYSIVADWLLLSQLTSPPNLLARLILSAMNWGLNKQDELFLEVEQHRRVAVMVVEACMKLVPGKRGLIAESFKQVSNIASMVCQTPTAEQAFCQWAWDLLLQLHLHLFSQPEVHIRGALDNPSDAFQSLPNLQRDSSLQSLATGVRERQPAACYVALAMTTIGHSIAELEQNWPLLTSLVESYQYKAAVHILSLISPLFYMNNTSLAAWEKFQPIVQLLLMCDLTYMKMAKNLVLPEFPGKLLRLFVAMILHSSEMASSLGSSKSAVFVTWLEVICNLHQWSRDRNALYVVDSICKAAFPEPNTTSIIRKFFVDYYKRIMDTAATDVTISAGRSTNPVSSFLWWVATGSSSSASSLLSRPSCPDFPWFSFCALDVEGDVEEENQVWKHVAMEMLHNQRVTPDAALKKVASRMHVSVPPLHQLAIYHWAQQSLDTPVEHPLNPLFWQRFFGLFLQRWPVDLGQPDKGSVGSRLFDSMSNVPLFKRMKKRLHDLADYHHRQAKEVSKTLQQDVENSGSDTTESILCDSTFNPSVKFHTNLARLYSTFVLWLDEPRLHDSCLYLPALPPQYDASRLLLMQHNDKAPWLEFVDFCQLRADHNEMIHEWLLLSDPRLGRPIGTTVHHEESATEQILRRLRSYEETIPPPPIFPLKAPVPEVTETMFLNENVTLSATRENFKILVDYAKAFTQHLSHHVALDKVYLDLLPDLHRNVESEMSVVVACKPGSAGLLRSSEARCSGPACISLRFKAKKLMEGIETRIEQNRTECMEVQGEVMLPPPQHVCSAAVFIENVLVYLVKKLHHQQRTVTQEIEQIGVRLFYYLHHLITVETNKYPPTRQFITTSIELLGQEFISGNAGQCEPLMKTILRDPNSVGLLAPHFTPTAATKETFIELYTQMVAVGRVHSADLAFVLLTKFDVSSWLATCRPRLAERQQILNNIGEVLLSTGLEPDDSLLPMYEIYRSHTQILMLYQFPDHYGDILQLLFKGSESQSLMIDVWYDVLNSLLVENRPAPFPLADQEQLSSVCHRFSQTQILFSSQQLRETLELFHNHFVQKRQASKELALYGLYSKFRPYVNAVSNFMALISHAWIASMKQGCKKQNFEDVAEREVWPVICHAFSPWVQPLRFSGKMTLPWVPADVQLAARMMTSFTQSIKYLHQVANYPPGLLSAFLDYYLSLCNAPETTTYLMATCYNQVFMSLDWPQFHPNSAAMQFIVKILNSGCSDCLQFLSRVFIQMQWTQIVDVWVHSESPLALTQHMEDLAHLLVRLAFEPIIRNGEEMIRLLQSAEMFPWHYVDGLTYENIVKSFVTNCDPACVIVISDEMTQDAVTLGLLKVCAGLVNWPTQLHPETQRKRCIYIRMFMQLLCAWTNKNKSSLKTQMDNIIKVLVELFLNMEDVIALSTPPGMVFNESVPILSEALNLVNCASVAELQDITILAVQSWAASRPRSTLLAPCLHAVCCGLASVIHMVTLTEALINIYFTEDFGDCTLDGIWTPIVTAVKVPELTHSDFMDECMRQNAYLTLYTTVLQQHVPGSCCPADLALLTQLVDWCVKTRPSEESEAKLLLLWNKIMELSILLSGAQIECETIGSMLISFSQSLLMMGEDKASAGFLGAIGLGKKSALSYRFRFAARAMAAFVLSHITPYKTLRTQPNEKSSSSQSQTATPRSSREVSPMALALQARTQLEGCKTNKQYPALQEQVEYVCSLVESELTGVHDYKQLMAYLGNNLFTEKNYLLVLRTNEQVGLQLCTLFM